MKDHIGKSVERVHGTHIELDDGSDLEIHEDNRIVYHPLVTPPELSGQRIFSQEDIKKAPDHKVIEGKRVLSELRINDDEFIIQFGNSDGIVEFEVHVTNS